MTRLATYEVAGAPRVGLVGEAGVIDLAAAAGALQVNVAQAPGWAVDVVSFLAAGQPAVLAAASIERAVQAIGASSARQQGLLIDPETAKLLPPIPRPPKIICVARNYGKHAAEAGRPISEIPIIFARFANTLVAGGANVVVPRVSEQLDWEGELAVVIGKPGRYITRDAAMEHVAGYSIFNDVTVRDYQFRVAQYTAGKNFAHSGPFGPHLVLADEVPDPHALQLTTWLNDEVVQDGNTSEMLFDIPTIIEHISEFIDLEVGDLIPMGTPAGVGFTRKPPRFLKHGDTIAVQVGKLGKLVNPVVDEAHNE